METGISSRELAESARRKIALETARRYPERSSPGDWVAPWELEKLLSREERRLHAAIAEGLRPKHRQIIQLRLKKDRATYKEIALEAGLTAPQSAKSWHSATVRMLQKRLHRDEFGETLGDDTAPGVYHGEDASKCWKQRLPRDGWVRAEHPRALFRRIVDALPEPGRGNIKGEERRWVDNWKKRKHDFEYLCFGAKGRKKTRNADASSVDVPTNGTRQYSNNPAVADAKHARLKITFYPKADWQYL